MILEEGKVKDIGVVVPYYKSKLSETEKIAFEQCQKILKRYPLILVVPDSMSEEDFPYVGDYMIEKVPCEWMQSIESYNEMMMSVDFYKRFLKYRYILIYQLDAFVFSDKLQKFCNFNYDYIGAPWFSGVHNYIEWKRKIIYVGNGGLSLRNVKACISVLNYNIDLLKQYKNKNEDCFFAACDGKGFHVAPKEVALSFSIEREVKDCFEANNGELPFGCHAWERYDLKFWKPYIEQFGYKIDEQRAKSGNEDQKNRTEYLEAKRYTALLENDDIFYRIPNKIEDLFIGRTERKYYLWGAGRRGRWVKSLLSDAGVKIEGFIDISQTKQKSYIEGIMVYSPEIVKKGIRIIISIKRIQGDEMEESLKKLGLKYLRDYIFFEDIISQRGEYLEESQGAGGKIGK